MVLEGNFAKRREILNRLKESLGQCEIVKVDESDNYNYVASRLMELSFSQINKLFIVDSLPSLSSEKDKSMERTKVLKYFSNIFDRIPDGNVIVFNNLNISSNKFLNEVKKYGKVLKFKDVYNAIEAKQHIFQYFSENNKKILLDEVDFIIRSLYSYGKVNIDKLNINLFKLDSYTGNKKNISKEDVHSIFVENNDFLIWDFYNILDKKDFCKSIEMLENYLSKSKNEIGEIILLLYNFRWRYKLLFLVHHCKNNLKMNKKDIFNEILKFNKMEQNGKDFYMYMEAQKIKGKDIPQYSDKMLHKTINDIELNNKKYTEKELEIILYSINKAIDKIRCQNKRTIIGLSEIKIAIEFVILTICGQITKKSILSVMNNNINDLISRKFLI